MPFFFKIRLGLLEIEASGVAIGKGGSREREKGDEHRRKRKSIHQEGKKKLPKKREGFCIKTVCNEWTSRYKQFIQTPNICV